VAWFLFKHLAFLLLTLLVLSFLVFSLNELSPGGAARKLLGGYAVPTAPGVAGVREALYAVVPGPKDGATAAGGC
jgi:ABC-type dipeptide/oligopeptide/nickel transport system permease component